jgi:hypothetical protein
MFAATSALLIATDAESDDAKSLGALALGGTAAILVGNKIADVFKLSEQKDAQYHYLIEHFVMNNMDKFMGAGK